MPALDGLRAVAVGMVFFVHAFPETTFPGWLGVDVFFLISGFLITRILLKQWARSGGIRLGRFYFNRAVRLWPPLIAVVVVFVVLLLAVGEPLLPTGGAAVIALTYTSNLVVSFTSLSLGPFHHTWSLAMEEQFYLLWPPLLLLMLRRRMPMVAVAVVAGVLALASIAAWVPTAYSTPYSPFTRAGGLLLGCALAALVHRQGWSSRPLAWAGLAVFALAIGLNMAGVLHDDWTLPLALLGLVPVVLHVAFGRGALVAVLGWRPIAYLGLISYGLYLWHYPIIWTLTNHAPALARWEIIVIALVATVLLSVATREWIEKPSLAWRDRRRAPVGR